MKIKDVFDEFRKTLSARTDIMTEDNIRYYWFAAMLNQDCDLNNYTLESPYKSPCEKKELDLLYKNELCFEIKFHRFNSKSDYAHTDAAGGIFDDIRRLPYFVGGPKMKRYFLYVTDDEMGKYLTNTSSVYRNNLNEFFNSEPEKNISLSFSQASTPKTFWNEANESLKSSGNTLEIPTIKLVYGCDISVKCPSFKPGGPKNNCHVRLYEIIDCSKS